VVMLLAEIAVAAAHRALARRARVDGVRGRCETRCASVALHAASEHATIAPLTDDAGALYTRPSKRKRMASVDLGDAQRGEDHANRTRLHLHATQARSSERALVDGAMAVRRRKVATQRHRKQEPTSPEAREEARAKRARAAHEGWVNRHARLAALASAAGNEEQLGARARKRRRMAADTHEDEDAVTESCTPPAKRRATDAAVAARATASPGPAGARAEVSADTRVDGPGEIGSQRARRTRTQAAEPTPRYASARAHEEAQREAAARAVRPPRKRARGGRRAPVVAHAGVGDAGDLQSDNPEVATISRVLRIILPGRIPAGCP
jgi:hypothetical protein